MTVEDFTTDRLVVRDWRPVLEDADKRLALETALIPLLSARVLAPLPPPLQLTGAEPDISRWVTDRAAEAEVFTISTTGSDELIGLLILASADDVDSTPDIHIGYLFAEQAWGYGYATELLRGLVSAFQHKGTARLIGGVAKGNIASARVLQKAGFTIDPALSSPDTDMFVHRIA